MPKITEKEFDQVWDKYNKNKDNLEIDRIDSFLKRHGCDREAWQNSEGGKKWIESGNRYPFDPPKLLDEEPIKFWLLKICSNRIAHIFNFFFVTFKNFR